MYSNIMATLALLLVIASLFLRGETPPEAASPIKPRPLDSAIAAHVESSLPKEVEEKLRLMEDDILRAKVRLFEMSKALDEVTRLIDRLNNGLGGASPFHTVELLVDLDFWKEQYQNEVEIEQDRLQKLRRRK